MIVLTDTRGLGAVHGCALVPTMGALHAGHAALIARAAGLARERSLRGGCCVSIFVNPTQFNDPGDLKRYPRTLDADIALAEASGATAIFAPEPQHVYPPDQVVPVPLLPKAAIDPGLEDARRPGHFAGVCQVVARLFDLLRPAAAVFGEKDWQQLAVIRAMTNQLGLPIDIVPCATVRDTDGVALSSRNVFLDATQRAAARSIPLALAMGARSRSAAQAQRAMRAVLERAGLAVEYAVVRRADTLAPLPGGALRPTDARHRLLIAARAGSTRLIDNAPWHASVAAMLGA